MPSLLLALAVPAHALDCTGLRTDVCEAANAVAEQINAAAGDRPVVYDEHPFLYRRPRYIYDRFMADTLPAADAACGPYTTFRIEGTIGGHWDFRNYGRRVWYGAWGDLGDPSTTPIGNGGWDGTHFWGDTEASEQLGASYHATYDGTLMTLELPSGYGGGFKRWLDHGDGFIANVYGSCVVPEPDFIGAHYDTVGNMALFAGSTAYSGPMDLFADDGFFGSSTDERVVAITDGNTLCDSTTAPFECTTALGGQLLVEEDGAFGYLPPTGLPTGAVDHFDVFARNTGSGALTHGRVELTQKARIWFVEQGGTGSGMLYEPAGALDQLEGPLTDGDIVYVGGAVPSGSGVVASGSIRFVGGDVPLLDLDLSLSGTHVPADVGYASGALVVEGTAVTLDVEQGPGVLDLMHLQLLGNGGPTGMVAIEGAEAYGFTAQHLTVDADGTLLRVHHDGPTTGSITFQGVQATGGTKAFDLTFADGSHDVSLSEVTFDIGAIGSVVASNGTHATLTSADAELRATAGLEVALDSATLVADFSSTEAESFADDLFTVSTRSDAVFDLVATDSLLLADDTLFACAVEDAASVRLGIEQAELAAGGQVLRVENTSVASPGFGMTLADSEVHTGFDGRSGIEVHTGDLAESRLAIGGSDLYMATGTRSTPAFVVSSDGYRATTALTLLDNRFQVSGSEALRAETLHPGADVCFDADANHFDRTVRLAQHQGSDFAIAGLRYSGRNAAAVAGTIEQANPGSRAEVEQRGGSWTVDYRSTSACALP